MSLLNAGDLHRIFKNLDKNGDGEVSLEELNWLLQQIGVELSPDKLEPLVGKKSLDLHEFLMFCDSILSKQNNNIREDNDHNDDNKDDDDLVEAFRVFDMNNDGFISCEELESVLSRLGLWDEKSGLDCKSMIGAFDGDCDGRVDFEEFKNMMLLNNI